MKVVIVGNGIAGNEVASYLREHGKDKDIDITILSAEKFPEYDPCSLPYFVGGEVDRNVVFRKSLDHYKKNRINLVLDNKAVSIDSNAKKVTTEKGDVFPYDSLVLAHGGSLFIPPIPGVNLDGVLSCKVLAEADKLARHKGTKAVVIGSGAIGIEAAEALKLKGYQVTIIELLDWIMPTLFCEGAARFLEDEMRGYGIEVYTSEKVLSIQGDGSVESVKTDKRIIPCDTVVIATGVVPGRPLAETAGVACDRGVLVNDQMLTNVDDIYACGDCVQTYDACTGEGCMYQLKHNAIEQARIVARNILGEKAQYRGAYPFARAHYFDTHAVTFGKTMKGAERICTLDQVEVLERSTINGYLRLLLKEGKIIGGQAIGKMADYAGLLMGCMWRGEDLHEFIENWPKIAELDSPYPWQARKLGQLLGLSSLDAKPGKGLERVYAILK
ncbi:MAG TPA: FAD-dependent oxidoreductase [Deltaproteobacteria bacterium]|nr:FAD-dependent oxidoreductase [Deltaproteobacteria bacterium]HQQ15031.1 FAD-dependent oxidoreductase [Deltaproteobacteria bacterium]